MKSCFILVIGCLTHISTHGQVVLPNTVPLQDLSAFREQAGNWRIVGDVVMDPEVDIHPKEETSKRGKKRKKSDQELPQAVTFVEGTGILLNLNDETHKDHLLTRFEHGDIELELEVMLPKGSNSGLYLQGRYEVQLFDSWRVRTHHPKYSDMGGIYRNWETEPGNIYMGKAPLINASKAPGLWQTLRLLFKAPRFDENGNKIENARFVYVDLNGVRIHDNVEVPLPTGGPIENNEQPRGPIMIQGDHGPVAIRNFRYQLLHNLDVRLSDLSYQVYYGDFSSFSDIKNVPPALTGNTPELNYEVAEKDDAFAIVFDGNIHISEDGDYQFLPEVVGGIKLTVNEKELVNLDRKDGFLGHQPFTINLKKGTYPIHLEVLKNVSWRSPRLGLFVTKADTYRVPLHAFSSNPPDEDKVPPVFVEPDHKPRLLRAFLDYKGERNHRITHSIGVGEPTGIHYIYDLKNGNLVCVWRGNFVEATPMWHDRGDGSFQPMGSPVYLQNNQTLSDADLFPQTSDENDFRGLGYTVDSHTGRPVFRYRYKDVHVTDSIYPANGEEGFVREIAFEGPASEMRFKLTEGTHIERMPNGSFAIDDKKYYVKVLSQQQPSIRDANGRKELVLPAGEGTIKYSIIW